MFNKKFMKKLTTVCVAVALSVIAMTGCGSGSSDSGNTNTTSSTATEQPASTTDSSSAEADTEAAQEAASSAAEVAESAPESGTDDESADVSAALAAYDYWVDDEGSTWVFGSDCTYSAYNSTQDVTVEGYYSLLSVPSMTDFYVLTLTNGSDTENALQYLLQDFTNGVVLYSLDGTEVQGTLAPATSDTESVSE